MNGCRLMIPDPCYDMRFAQYDTAGEFQFLTIGLFARFQKDHPC